MDPAEEGAKALSETSHVAKRLAAKAGIGGTENAPLIPATTQHSVIPNHLAKSRVPLAFPADGKRQWSPEWTRLAWIVAVAILVVVVLIGITGILRT